ncbi:MAG: alginate lyase family protein, partial [Flavisolibacter sp.]
QARQIVDRMVKATDSYLNFKPVSVTQKQLTPVSGNKHDYMSQAPYFWYDSSKPNGLPYLRKDGVRNPEINKITDHKNMGDLENAVKSLALGWYFTGNEKYAAKAASLLRTWFFDEATRMNPNLEYAQGIPGINNGRGIGIIESRSLTGIADAAGLLSGSISWTTADTKKLKDWYSQYLDWMLNSKNGKDEHAAKNNHGTWYFVQAMHFALFTGNQKKALQLADEARQRLDSQLASDGRQPLELERTKALGYSTMNLRGWFEAATLANQLGVDLWNYKTSKGASLKTAFDWLLPYAVGEKEFTYQQIEKYNTMELYPLLLQAADKYHDERYLVYFRDKIKGTDPMYDLLYAR